ncbi:MAG: TonB-dependent receptor plug domain-containing protein, partial [Coprobacter sp.]|nr:TonB-dependent receptor plug domain-containing protein [Coprobacter sp.]
MKIGKKNIVLLLLAFLINIPLWADTFEDGVNLDEIVVAGSRWTQNRDLQPIKISRLGFEESNQYNPQTAADLLNISGEVFIQKSQYGGGSPMIRGFATNRLLYSVDGVRMNTAIYRAGNIQNVISLDPFAIGSSEILFGPGAVGYGSDAIGGVMIFNTLKTKLSVADTPLVYGSATLRTATASTEFTGHAHVGVGFKKWGFVTSFTYSNFNDLKQGTHGPEDYIKQYNVQPNYVAGEGVNDIVTLNNDKRKQTPSGYNQFNVMQKLRYTPTENWNLEYAFHY